MSIKDHTPWYVKIPAKIVLSRLPVSHHAWRRLGIFRHGSMNDPGYVIDVFSRHSQWFPREKYPDGFTMLELGPGDSIASGLIAFLHGASRSYLVDHGDYIVRDIPTYRGMLAKIRRRGITTLPLEGFSSFEDLCRRSATEYLTEGTRSLEKIPTGSVDFIFSNAVLEHVRLHEFDEMLKEMKRVLAGGGVCSHEVDLKDHLSSSLNNLRFPDWVWESGLFAESGFYTNRIRFAEMLDRFRRAGFAVEVVDRTRWDGLPLARSSFSAPFKRLDEDDLLISSFNVLLTEA